MTDTTSNYAPGGDAKVIAEIAKKKWGGFKAMFEYHKWPERGSAMMTKVQTRVAEEYGSVKAFENQFLNVCNTKQTRKTYLRTSRSMARRWNASSRHSAKA